LHLVAHEDARIEKRSGCNDQRSAPENTGARMQAANSATFNPQGQRLSDEHFDPALGNESSHSGTIEPTICLEPWPLHCRPFAPVEHAAVDCCPVRRARHESVEHVELTHKVALADATDRGVTRHLANVFRPECDQADPRAAAGRSGSSLAPGVAGSDNENVEHRQALSGFWLEGKISSQTTCFT
jgi:hypothetical protein